MSKNFLKLDFDPKNKNLISTIYFSFLINGMLAIMIGALQPYIIDEYHLNYVQSGLLISFHQGGNLLAVLIAGILPFAIGRKKSTTLLTTGMVLGFILMIVTRNPVLLFVAFALTGVTRGTLSNVCNTVVSENIKNKTVGLNILHAFFAIGALFSAPLILLCIDLTPWGWKTAPLVLAFAGILVVSLFYKSALSNHPTKKIQSKSVPFFKSTLFWMNTAILFFYLCSEASIIGWFVVYFKKLGIFSPLVSTLTSTFLWVMILFGRLFTASVVTKVDKNKFSLGLGVLFGLFFILLVLNISPVFSFISLLGIGFSMSGIYPTTFASMENTDSSAVTGTTIAIASIGGILMPSIVGFVAKQKGLEWGIATILFALFIMLVLMVIKIILIKRKGGSK